MTIKPLVSAAFTGLLLTTANLAPVAGQTATQHQALASDSAFLQTAGSIALLQVKLGKLAQEQGSSDLVRDFGQRMATEYAKTNDALAAGAKQAAYPKPVLLRPHQSIFDRLNHTNKADFDKKYMAEMVNQHDEAVRVFEQEAKDGRIQSLKQLAASLLPEVQERLGLATQTASSVGANVTAATAPERKGS